MPSFCLAPRLDENREDNMLEQLFVGIIASVHLSPLVLKNHPLYFSCLFPGKRGASATSRESGYFNFAVVNCLSSVNPKVIGKMFQTVV